MTSDVTRPPDGTDPMETGALSSEPPGHIEEWESQAIDLLDGTLDPETAAPLEAHLAACARCREALEQQRAMAALFQAAPLASVPAAIEAGVFEALAPTAVAGSALVDTPAPESPRSVAPSPAPGVLERLRAAFSPRVWLPAAAMLLIAGVAISTYYRSGLDSARDSSAVLTEEKASSDGEVQEAAPSSEGGTTPSVASTSTTMAATAFGAGSTSTTSGATETTAPYASDQAEIAAMLDELDTRLDALTARAAPGSFPVAWLHMDAGPGDTGAAAAFVESLTSLLPLAPEAWMEGLPTFAALASPDDIQMLAQILGVDLAWATPAAGTERTAPVALVELISDPDRLTELKMQSVDATPGLPTWDQVDPSADITAGEDLAVMVLMLEESAPAPAE